MKKKWIVTRMLRAIQWLRVLLYEALSTGNCEGTVCKRQPVLILGEGIVKFGKNVTLGYFPSAFFLDGCVYLEARGKHSCISVGEHTQVNNNFVAVAEHTAIKIGKRCLIGTNVEMLDSDFHGMKVSDRRTSNAEQSSPVVIGDDVFIGSNVRIMKGVVVGNGAVIANGAIVVNEIPADVVAGGNPAKVLRIIER